MKEKPWLKALFIYVLAYIWIAVIIVTTSYLLGYLLLDMPFLYVSILTGLSLLVVAIGLFGKLIANNMKRKNK